MAFFATGNQEEALDIVQDAMLTLVKRYAQRNPEEWGPLFTRIVQNRIRDWYRREKVRNKWRVWFGKDDADQQDIENLPDSGTNDPLRQIANAGMTDELEHALRGLPLRQQQVFLLRVWEGLDVAETAKSLGISSGSVKTHYSRAVHRLREVLGDYHHE
jgi:RNA polymerase sigma-70 factor (ECF subfamily)